MSNIAIFIFKVDGISDELRVVRFNGTEQISEPFHFNLELAVAKDTIIDFDSIIGKSAVLTLYGAESTEERYISGIVSSFVQSNTGVRYTHYYAELVPTIWLLSQKKQSQIFQNKTVPKIIEEVLTKGSIPADRFKFSLQGSYEPRIYCTQYRESDLNFISRLMEEEGIFYYFEHTQDSHVMLIADDSAGNKTIQDPSTVIFHPMTSNVPSEDFIFEYKYSQKIRSGAVMLRDYNFVKPTMNLDVKKQTDENTSLEIYDYPGKYDDKNIGEDLAKIRLEEYQSDVKIASGQSSCKRLVPGFKFTLDRYDRPDFNIEYIITKTSHYGQQKQVLEEEAPTSGIDSLTYKSAFECIPSDVPYRPPQITPQPVVQGAQTAIVVGPSGEEIYTDEFGRVKVQFHWDREGKRDENSSCWIRVSQVWAGAGWGAIQIPRIGQEVIVNFLEGDPSQPIIIGRVYHGVNRPPYKLPAEKTKSTIQSVSSPGGGGFNEMRFEDATGNEEIYLHGQKNWTIAIENDKNQTVGNNESLNVGVDRTKNVGNDQKESVGNDQKETIGSNKKIEVGNDHDETIGSNMTISVGANLSESIGANMTSNVSKNLSESIGVNLSTSVGKNYKCEAGENGDILIGKKCKIQSGDDFTISVGKKAVIDIKDQLTFKCGQASIILKKSGDIQIKGKKLNLKASGDIKMKGSKISEN